MFKQSLLILTLLGSPYWALANDAQTVTERQRLENAMSELLYIQKYVRETKATQQDNVRSRFDYPRFDGDIDLLRHGISEYLSDIPNKPKGQERSSRSVSGNYKK